MADKNISEVDQEEVDTLLADTTSDENYNSIFINDESINDESDEDESINDESIEDESIDDESIDDKSDEDESDEDESIDDESDEDESIDDESDEDESINDESDEDESIDDESINDESDGDESIDDESDEDESINDESDEDESINDESDEDESIDDESDETENVDTYLPSAKTFEGAMNHATERKLKKYDSLRHYFLLDRENPSKYIECSARDDEYIDISGKKTPHVTTTYTSFVDGEKMNSSVDDARDDNLSQSDYNMYWTSVREGIRSEGGFSDEMIFCRDAQSLDRYQHAIRDFPRIHTTDENFTGSAVKMKFEDVESSLKDILKEKLSDGGDTPYEPQISSEEYADYQKRNNAGEEFDDGDYAKYNAERKRRVVLTNPYDIHKKALDDFEMNKSRARKADTVAKYNAEDNRRQMFRAIRAELDAGHDVILSPEIAEMYKVVQLSQYDSMLREPVSSEKDKSKAVNDKSVEKSSKETKSKTKSDSKDKVVSKPKSDNKDETKSKTRADRKDKVMTKARAKESAVVTGVGIAKSKASSKKQNIKANDEVLSRTTNMPNEAPIDMSVDDELDVDPIVNKEAIDVVVDDEPSESSEFIDIHERYAKLKQEHDAVNKVKESTKEPHIRLKDRFVSAIDAFKSPNKTHSEWSTYYDTSTLLKTMGAGEAIVDYTTSVDPDANLHETYANVYHSDKLSLKKDTTIDESAYKSKMGKLKDIAENDMDLSKFYDSIEPVVSNMKDGGASREQANKALQDMLDKIYSGSSSPTKNDLSASL